ncbi:MAG: hypothetical protein SCARUB_01290 [Candidatus Scalindua rubra]|uniref:Uncharacterized protein n=1 Tax=Candidatus Scalindua rubra TaxID=1872076 RepID=A0A1E3XD49_9BACT|nr:MAG: hypothetical protein SCARUB_01290 [Candidatus Scalindua rubra]
MKKVEVIDRIQVKGKRYNVPAEDVEIERLIKRCLSIKKKIGSMKEDLEGVESRLIEIARARREGTTTVTLNGISVQSLITFRESYQVKNEIIDIKKSLGPLFTRFFTKKEEFKATGDFKKFMESDHALGIKNPRKVKAEILKYVSVKETKPSVKMEPQFLK